MRNAKPGIYNLAEHNFSVNDLLDGLREIYPELEYIYVNQNIRLRDVMIDKNDNELLKSLNVKKDFVEELKEFKDSFSF